MQKSLVGDDLPARLKELQTKAELAATTAASKTLLVDNQLTYRKRTKAYSKPPMATHSSNRQPTVESKGPNKVCIKTFFTAPF